MMKIISSIIVILLSFSSYVSESIDNIVVIYYGRSCFEINFNGKRIVIDPFDPEFFEYSSPKNKYILPEGKIDYAFASHNARDHNYFKGIDAERTYFACGVDDAFVLTEDGITTKLRGKTTDEFGEKFFAFWTVPSYHDDQKGALNGVNGIICLKLDDIKFIHLGDLGHVLEQEHINAIGCVDVLAIPVDERYTIDADTAKKIVDQLNPRIVIPMHYKTDNLKKNLPFSDEKNFIKQFKNVKRHDKCFLSVNKKDLKKDTQVVILKYCTGIRQGDPPDKLSSSIEEKTERTESAWNLWRQGKIKEALAAANSICSENSTDASARHLQIISSFVPGKYENCLTQYDLLDPKYDKYDELSPKVISNAGHLWILDHMREVMETLVPSF